MKKKEKKILSVQAQMFGRDMVEKQLKMLDDLGTDKQELGKSVKGSVALNEIGGDVSEDDEGKVDVFAGAAPGGKKDLNLFNFLVIS